MKNDNSAQVLEKIISLIESEFESDAAFERSVGLADKTVSNWRRGRSASYMKMLPRLSEIFKVNIGDLLGIPLTKDTSELSDEELKLLYLYRKTRTMPVKMRTALRETLENTIKLYLASVSEVKRDKRAKVPKK